MDSQQLRSLLLTVIEEQTPKNSWDAGLQSSAILKSVARKAGLQGDVQEQVLLALFNDMFRSGYLSWGLNLANPGPPFFHVTESGRSAVRMFSRDPANPDGYLHHLTTITVINPIAASYLSEALNTYNSNNYKAAAVMIGAVSESIILEVRTDLISRLEALRLDIPKELESWQVKKILRGIDRVLEPRIKLLPTELNNTYPAYWPAFTEQIRKVRNDSGHPSSIDPVTFEDVHAAFLIFPLMANMAAELRKWIKNDLV